uniref:DNA/RNA non-specific endonuclease domain-containing protein n=1 Tax=Esox lucius TaxID=8010 RepID=A0AAY5K368_ESOLU
MARLFLLVLTLSVISAVRGEVVDNFNQCKQFFFNERPVQGLDIALPTPEPLSLEDLYLEKRREVYVELYKKMYNKVKLQKEFKEVQLVLEPLKIAIDEVNPELNFIQSQSEKAKSELQKHPEIFQKLKPAFDSITKELEDITKSKTSVENDEQLLQNIKDDLEVRKVCHSAYLTGSPAHICQKKGNLYHFATMYDRGRRIPLYSAYKMDRSGKTKREGDVIYYEPQLVHAGLESEQNDVKKVKGSLKKYNKDNECNEKYPAYKQTDKLRWSQATDDDFASFDRGHLNPAGHHAEGEGSKATMTFTNVAPQNEKMNKEAWSKYETKLRIKYGGEFTAGDEKDRNTENIEKQKCDNLYVVTGVVPTKKFQFGRVNVPSHYWSAHCCTEINNGKEVPVLSGGALCPNTDDGKVEEFDRITDLEERLKELIQEQLQIHLTNPISIFDNCASTSII